MTTRAFDDGVDEQGERWVTAVHEAGHAIAVDSLGGRVVSCRVDARHDNLGSTRHTLEYGTPRAIVAVAGERATRILLGRGGGSGTDYQHAATALTGTGHDLDWAEEQADHLLSLARRDVHALARQLYRTGHR